MTVTSPGAADAAGGQGSSKTPQTSSVTSLPANAAVIITIAVLAVILATTIFLVVHYPTSSDVTSVLGVVTPTLTAIVGGALGAGAGVAAGSSGKQAVQQQLSSTQDALSKSQGKVQQANTVLQDLSPKLGQVLAWLETQCGSEPGSNLLMANLAGRPDSQPGIESEVLDSVKTSVGTLHGLLGPDA